MVNVKCPHCGEQFQIDENARDRRCPVCGQTVTAEQNATDEDVRRHFRTKKEEIEKECRRALEQYEQSGSVKGIHTLIENYVSYRSVPWFYDLWSRFILDVAGVCVQKKDSELQTYLKNHAKKYDAENTKTAGGLYLSVLQSYPNVGTNNDWDDLIRRTQGDQTKFTVLSENIINYIVRSKDKAFAMDIFYLLAAKEEEWSEAGRIYLRILLSSDDVAAQVFPRSAFNGRTKKFVLNVRAYCRKYLSEGNKITLEETKVWQNYSAACKFQKRRNIGIAAAVLAVLIGVSAGVYFYLNAPAAGSVEFDVDRVIETTYGEPLDLSGYTVTYRKNSGTEVKLEMTQSMLSGYDPELIGQQQTVYVEYAGARLGITILVNAATLDTPQLMRSGNYVTWDFVPNAAGYSVYVNSTSAPVTTTESLSYDLSTDKNWGELRVTVRANAPSEKYTNSAMSDPLVVTKLQAPQNLAYAGGVLSWDAVDGAESYEISVNGTPYTSETNRYSVDLAQGANEILIVAKSASAIDGVTSATFTYSKLDAVGQVYYGGNRIYWDEIGNATGYSVYVGNEHWKDIVGRSYIDLESDGFIELFGEGEQTIGILSRSSLSGVEDSELAEFVVDVGNRVRRDDEALRWDSVGSGATYFVELNGKTFSFTQPYMTIAGAQWIVGKNTMSVTANLNNRTIVCETVTVTKLAAPSVSVQGGEWVTDADGDVTAGYRFDAGEWGASLPAISEIAAGDHTLEARRIAGISDPYTLEIDSETTTFRIRKLATPNIYVTGGELAYRGTCEGTARIYYCADGQNDFISIDSLSGIKAAGTYTIYVVFTASDELKGQYDCVLDSERSALYEVTKLAAPDVIYNQGDERVTSSSAGAKFFYMQNGVEYELEQGLVSNLPKGNFEVYARLIAGKEGELSSENTPQSERVSVYNMNITLTISKRTSTQMFIIFGNCKDIASITFTYEIIYRNEEGIQIGRKTSSGEITYQNTNAGNTITGSQNYMDDINFEKGFTKEDIDTVELVVTISVDGGSGGQILHASMQG